MLTDTNKSVVYLSCGLGASPCSALLSHSPYILGVMAGHDMHFLSLLLVFSLLFVFLVHVYAAPLSLGPGLEVSGQGIMDICDFFNLLLM